MFSLFMKFVTSNITIHIARDFHQCSVIGAKFINDGNKPGVIMNRGLIKIPALIIIIGTRTYTDQNQAPPKRKRPLNLNLRRAYKVKKILTS